MPEKLKLLLCHFCGFGFTENLHDACPRCNKPSIGIASFLHQILTNQGVIMAAIDNLNANVSKLGADVDALLALPAQSDAAVQAAADAVAAVDAKIVAVLPPPPAPAG